MKKIRKLALAAICMLFLLNCKIDVRAAETPSMALSAPESVKQGERFAVSVSILENPGLASMQLRIVFPESWRFIEAEAGEKFGGSTVIASPSEASPVTVIWSYSGDEKTDGELLRLSFEADIDAAAGEGLVIVQCQNAYTGEEQPVALGQKSARVSVTELGEDERPRICLVRNFSAGRDRIAVDISGSNKFRASTAQLKLLYDERLLELTEIVPNPDFPADIYLSESSAEIAWASLGEITDGVIATCFFRLLSDDESAYPASVELSGKLYDVSEKEIHGTVFAGTEIGFAGGVSITGTVTSFGSEAYETRVELWQGGVMVAAAAASPEYGFHNVAAGKYTLRVTKAGHGAVESVIDAESTDITKNTVIYMMGDVNRSGTVTATDANWIRQYVVGSRTFDDYQTVLADVNQSGGAKPVTATDANWVRQRVVGARDERYIQK